MKNYFYYLYQDDGFTDRIVKGLILKQLQQKNKVIVVTDDYPWGFSRENPPDYAVLGSGDDLCSISGTEGVELLFTDSFEDDNIQKVLDSDACIVWNCPFSKFYVLSSPATQSKILARASKQIDIFTDPYGYIDNQEQSPMEQFLRDAGPVFDGIFCSSYYRISHSGSQLKPFKEGLSFKKESVIQPYEINPEHGTPLISKNTEKRVNLLKKLFSSAAEPVAQVKNEPLRKVTFYVVNSDINKFTFNFNVRDDYEKLAQLFSIY